ncbi:MAG: peptide-methionine (R)-S-oxide reductase MsrB [Burkholderiales bacterium]|nr:peptide-methionine (R)-S-oxide reductase MsrB [Burkholderiales bacterium]
MKRRSFLSLIGLTAASVAVSERIGAARAPADTKAVKDLQAQWRTLLADGAKVELSREPLKRTEAEWKKLLTAEQFHILREEGTERAGTSPLNNEKRPGVFVCAGCALPLFTSAMKYDSGTGWPSFFTTIADVVATKRDFKLLLPRTEYHCVRCGGHHGHVFEDGPPPTGLRYCNNGIALRFLPKA